MEKDIIVGLIVKKRTVGLNADEQKQLEKLLEVTCMSESAYNKLADIEMSNNQ